MKALTLFLTITSLLARTTRAQSWAVVFNTRGGGVDAPVASTITGERVTGNTVLAQLYYGPNGQDPAAFHTFTNPPAWFTTGTLAGYILNSTGGGNRTLDPAVVAPGSGYACQVRAWEAVLGFSWDEAWVNFNDPSHPQYGKAALGLSELAIGPPVGLWETPIPLIGLQGFSIAPIPEPGVLTLGVLGMSILLSRRYRALSRAFESGARDNDPVRRNKQFQPANPERGQ